MQLNNYYTNKEAYNLLGKFLTQLRKENKIEVFHEGKQKLFYKKEDIDKFYKEIQKENLKKQELQQPRPCLNCGKIIEKPKINQKCCCRSCSATYQAKHTNPNGIIKCKKCLYKGQIISGTFELRTAYILDKMLENKDITSWEYTNDTIKYISFDNKEHSYLLDFKFIDLNNDINYIEVKGVKTNIDEYKWKSANEQNINLNIWFLENIELKEQQYSITKEEIENLFDECVENYKANKITKKCKCCGKEFITTKIKNTEFCSTSCSMKYYNKYNNKLKIQYTKQCPICGKEFITTTKKGSNCCSEKCYNEEHLIGGILHCQYCGKEFVKKQYRQIYCSDECRYNDSISSETKICKQCGKEFKGNGTKKYCSEECHKLSRRKVLICKQCNKEFYGTGNTKFCSNECKNLNKKQKYEFDYITLKK